MGSITSEYEEAVAVKSSITASHSIHPGQCHTARVYSQWPLDQVHLTILIIYNPIQLPVIDSIFLCQIYLKENIKTNGKVTTIFPL